MSIGMYASNLQAAPHVLWHLLYLALPLEIKIGALSGIKHLRSQQTLTLKVCRRLSDQESPGRKEPVVL